MYAYIYIMFYHLPSVSKCAMIIWEPKLLSPFAQVGQVNLKLRLPIKVLPKTNESHWNNDLAMNHWTFGSYFDLTWFNILVHHIVLGFIRVFTIIII